MSDNKQKYQVDEGNVFIQFICSPEFEKWGPPVSAIPITVLIIMYLMYISDPTPHW